MVTPENSNSREEAIDLFKNGTDWKSLTTRGSMKIHTLLVFMFTMVLISSFSSCNSKDNPDDPKNTTSVFATLEMNINVGGYQYNEVVAFVYEAKWISQTVAQTTDVRNPVKLTFRDVSNECLVSFDRFGEFLHSSSSTSMWFLSSNLAKFNISNPEARTAIATVRIYPSSITLHSSDTAIGLLFSNADCDITGEARDGNGTNNIVDIRLKKGWNMVVYPDNYNHNVKERRITTKLLQGETWYNFEG